MIPRHDRPSPDTELLRAAARGDARAVGSLLDQVGPILYGFVYARVGGDEAVAEDVVQDTFVEAMRSADGFRGDAALSTWLCAIARRRLARYFERERRQAVAAQGLRLVGIEDVTTEEAVLDQRDEVIRALGRIPAGQRQVLVLKYLDNRTVAEIAEEIDRTAVQVQSLLQRARASLRRELDASDG